MQLIRGGLHPHFMLTAPDDVAFFIAQLPWGASMVGNDIAERGCALCVDDYNLCTHQRKFFYAMTPIKTLVEGKSIWA